MYQRVTCPITSQRREIEYDENPVDGTILGVRTCTAFRPKDTVTCDAACIDHLNASFLLHIYEGRRLRKYSES